jgi:TrpR-related protein YerC/YecD
MAKRRFTDDSWRKEPWFKALVAAFRSCSTDQDMENFLRDIGTLSELQAWSERFEVAKQLAQGKKYREIAINTGASTTTVTRVAKFLENGEGGYRKVLNAHRHHRMVTSSGEQRSAESTGGDQPKKPVSVLQKYLEKAKEQG